MSKLNDDIARNTNTYRPVYESSGVPGVLGLVHQISAPSDGGASKTRLLQIAGLVQAALEGQPEYRSLTSAHQGPDSPEEAGMTEPEPAPSARRTHHNITSEAAKDQAESAFGKSRYKK